MCNRCRFCTCGPVFLRVAVMLVVGVEMLHDSIVLGLMSWRLVLTSARYEAAKEEWEPEEVVGVVTEVILRSLDLMFTALLLYGVIKENRRAMMAWFWWSACCLVLSMVIFIWVAVYMAQDHHLIGIPIVVFSFIIAISILFLVVVRSYVKYLERKEMFPTILINEYDDDEDV